MKLTGEGMVAAFFVCVLIMGLSQATRWIFSDKKRKSENDVAVESVPKEAEEVSAIAAALYVASGGKKQPGGVTVEAARDRDTEAWTRRSESDLPEGGRF